MCVGGGVVFLLFFLFGGRNGRPTETELWCHPTPFLKKKIKRKKVVLPRP